MLGHKSFEKQGNYYSPKRQRGIFGFAAEKPKHKIPHLRFGLQALERRNLKTYASG